MIKDHIIRRMAEEPTKPKRDQEVLDKQIQEFLAKGGEIQQLDVAATAFDYTVTAKPGETWGKSK